MKYYTAKPGKYPDKENQNTDDEFFGTGWSVKRENDHFFFCYVSGSLQGEFKKVEIAKEDFEMAKAGKITFDQLCIKYNVS